MNDVENTYRDFLRKSYGNEIIQKNYLMNRLVKTDDEVRKELGITSKWRYRWFMLFRDNRERFRQLFNVRLFGNGEQSKPVEFNSMGDIEEITKEDIQ